MDNSENTSAGLMRTAAKQMASSDDPIANATALIVTDAAQSWDSMVKNTQAGSRGVDQPPAIFHGKPAEATAHADKMFANVIRLVRAWIEAHPSVPSGPDAKMYGAKHFCTRCIDNEACAAGWPCSTVLAREKTD